MPRGFSVLLDQNVPYSVKNWISQVQPTWTVHHCNEIGLNGESDDQILAWASKSGSVIFTFDEDFTNYRSPISGHNCGIVRLNIWPTTYEETVSALGRLFESCSEVTLFSSRIIIDQNNIRVRGL